MRELYEVNVFGLTRLTQAALPLLRLATGRIVNIGGWLQGRGSWPFFQGSSGVPCGPSRGSRGPRSRSRAS